jgi:hypothetical protein
LLHLTFVCAFNDRIRSESYAKISCTTGSVPQSANLNSISALFPIGLTLKCLLKLSYFGLKRKTFKKITQRIYDSLMKLILALKLSLYVKFTREKMRHTTPEAVLCASDLFLCASVSSFVRIRFQFYAHSIFFYAYPI